MAFATLCACGGPSAQDLPAWTGVSAPVLDDSSRALQLSPELEAALETVAVFRQSMTAGDFDAAFHALSYETRLLLDRYHPQGGEEALRRGELLVEGRAIEFDPLYLFAGPQDPGDLRPADTDDTQGPAVSASRVLLEDAEGENRWIIIKEAGVWRLHRPRLDLRQLAPELRSQRDPPA